MLLGRCGTSGGGLLGRPRQVVPRHRPRTSEVMLMKLAILSRSPNAYSTRRLRAQQPTERGHHQVQGPRHPAVRDRPLRGRARPPVPRASRCPTMTRSSRRIGASITFYGLAVVRQFEQMDVYTPNTAAGIANSRDKLRAIQISVAPRRRHPRDDVRARSGRRVCPRSNASAASPVVIKLLEGTQGIGVILAPTPRSPRR